MLAAPSNAGAAVGTEMQGDVFLSRFFWSACPPIFCAKNKMSHVISLVTEFPRIFKKLNVLKRLLCDIFSSPFFTCVTYFEVRQAKAKGIRGWLQQNGHYVDGGLFSCVKLALWAPARV